MTWKSPLSRVTARTARWRKSTASSPPTPTRISKSSSKTEWARPMRSSRPSSAPRGDVVMILDSDLTVPPEQLPKFWNALASGKGEFVNGSRLVYPMEKEAMRFLNLVANRIFSILFTWLLNQRFTDTLCGTKVIMRRDFERVWRNRGYFGNFDPFGDFELIFGASKLNLKVVEIPV